MIVWKVLFIIGGVALMFLIFLGIALAIWLLIASPRSISEFLDKF